MNMDEVNLDEFCFIAVFQEGYNIRNLIEYLKTTSTSGNFVFTKDSISYREMDKEEHICVDILINTNMIKSYKFNSDNDILVGVQLSDLRIGTKLIGKKDEFCMYMKKELVNSYLYIQPIPFGSGLGKSTTHFVKTMNIEPTFLEMPTYEQTETCPNTETNLIQFTRACKNVASIKSEYVLVKAYPKGIRFTSYIQGKINGIDEKFGNCSYSDEQSNKYPDFNKLMTELSISEVNNSRNEELPTIEVSPQIFKSLGKINNTSTNGSVTFHMEKDRPLKIRCPIGKCGILSIYISDRPKK